MTMTRNRSVRKRIIPILLVILTAACGVGLVSLLLPQKAEAATAGSYYVKITCQIKFSSSWRCSKLNNTFTAGWDSTTNDSAGVVIRHKSNNGNGSQSDTTVDLHGWYQNTDNTSYTSKTATTTVEGFPTGFYFCLDQNDFGVGGGTTYLQIKQIEIGSSSSNLTTIWTGSTELASTNQTKKATISQTWDDPAATSMSSGAAISGAAELTIPKTGAGNVTSGYTNSGTVKDQYGVNWYQDLVYYLADSEPQSVGDVSDSFDSDKASIGAAGDLTLTSDCQIAGTTNYVYAWVCAKRGNAWLKMRVKFVDPKYAVKFYDGNGSQFGSTQNVYYGDNATNPGTPTKSYDSTNHYTFSSWNTYTNITADRNVGPNFTPVAHTLAWEIDTEATCETAGVKHEACSGCAYTTSANTAIAALGHSWGGATYTWSGCSSCSASRTCSRDSSHTDIANATILSAVTTAATCTDPGVRTYTATFSDAALATQTKTENIPADPGNHASYGYPIDASTVLEPTYDTNGYTGDKKCSGCHAVREAGETVPRLEALIELPDVSLEDVSLDGVCSIAPTVRESDISYEIVGFAAAGDHTLYKSSNKPNDATTLKLANARIRKTSASGFSYRFSSMEFADLESFYVLVKVSGTDQHKYSVSDVYTYEKVTLVPPQNVLFDDASPAIAFSNSQNASSGYGVWRRINDGGAAVSDSLDEFGDPATAKSGYGNSIMYSLGDAHQVSVSNTLGAKWPTAQFTFTGSGFDVVSVTDSSSGVFGVKVYNGAEVKQKADRSTFVDTYYGYSYTQLFYNPVTHKIVDSSDENRTALYAAVSATPEATRIYGGFAGRYFYTTDTEYAEKDGQENPVPAYGWLVSGSSNVLYQVPCIHMDLGAVGTYTVVIQPMFTEMFGHCNETEDAKYYNFTLDGIRIYNPVGRNNEALAVYARNGETYTNYESIRESIKDADLILVDGKTQLTKTDLAGYLEGAPKNELYLLKNGTAAFDVAISDLTDARIGLKAANGTPCTATVCNADGTTRTFEIGSATEQFFSLAEFLASSDSPTVTVTNGGDGILSITRLLSTSNTPPPSPAGAPQRRVSFSPRTAAVAQDVVQMLNADISIREASAAAQAAEDGTVTITLTTGADTETIVVRDADGNVIDPDAIGFDIDQTGVKHWTVVFTEEREGDYVFLLQAVYENGYTGGAEPTPTEVRVTFTAPTETAGG
ncbi:MAG: hypothetical protein IJL26_08980, partial [Clostridia bacterium]|nr:hypothetical protein [Clostridia bacterium]